MKRYNARFRLEIVANQLRRETFQGREHLVSPVVAVQEMVLPNSTEFLPGDEIEASVGFWEGVPIAIGHPTRNGEGVSAGGRDVQENDVIGRMFDVFFHNPTRSLRGELWIDLERAPDVEEGEDLVDRLQGAEGTIPVEVSTAYFAKVEPQTGEFDGVAFNGIQREIRPDHIAILLDEMGACSVKDGCGTPRLNDKGSNVDKSLFTKALDLLNRAINSEDDSMDRKKIIETLKANKACPFSAERLEELKDDELTKLSAMLEGQSGDGAGKTGDNKAGDANKAAGAAGDGEGKSAGAADAGSKQAPAANAAPALSAEDRELLGLLKNVGVDRLKEIASTDVERKKTIIEKIVANKANGIDKAILETMSFVALESIDKMIAPASYAGVGYVYETASQGGDSSVPPPPSVVLRANEDKTADKTADKTGDKKADK